MNYLQTIWFILYVAKILKAHRSISYLLSLGDVIQRANDVPYGLCASVWTENSGRIHRVASKLKVHYHYIFDLFFVEVNFNDFIPS